MAAAPGHRREIKQSRIGGSGLDSATLDALSKRAKYRPSGKHKDYPAPAGEWVLVTPASDEAKCCRFRSLPDAQRLLEHALREAIREGVVSDQVRGQFPSRAWVYVNGVLHEARLTNEETGQYHGFPLADPGLAPRDPRGLLASAPKVSVDVA